MVENGAIGGQPRRGVAYCQHSLGIAAFLQQRSVLYTCVGLFKPLDTVHSVSPVYVIGEQ